MILPKVENYENKKASLTVFKGLNQRDKISDIEFSDMENMSAAVIPAVSPRRPRYCVAEVVGGCNIVSPEYTGGTLGSFTGVKDKHFYYKGSLISGNLTAGQKSVADFNGKICIFPDKVYYDYMSNPDTGVVSTSLTDMEKTMTVSGASFYSSYNTVTGEYTAYITASGADFDDNFKVGDSICISGCTKTENNTKIIESRKDYAAEKDIISAVCEKVAANRIDFLLYNKKGEKVCFTKAKETGSITLKKAVPDMSHICVHNNRLWGTSKSGEYIYASKLGDCTDFYSFQGLSDDSWYSYIGTGGKFTGICSYRTAVVAFKRNCIHHIYGDDPVNFSIPKQTFGGCIDGRSICETGGILYYLANDGFYGYSGGEPYCISPQIKQRYSSCAAGSDGKHYYASATDKNGISDVLVYTPDYDVWMREDNKKFEDFCCYNGSLYGIADNKMWRLDCGEDEAAESFNWSFTSKRFTYDMIEHKGLSCMWIRADVESDTKIDVSVSADGEDFKVCGRIDGSKNRGFCVTRIPVRFKKCDSFRIKLSGKGKAVIHDIEISSHNGGRII